MTRLGAVSRPTGSAACDDARRYCAEVLRNLGFVVREHSFEYSQFIGRWGASLAGLAAAVVTTAVYLGASGNPLKLLGALAAVVFVAAVLPRRGVLGGRVLRAAGANLAATRGQDAPSVWLVAHIDSKWQPVSMLVRVAGVVAIVIGVLAVLAGAVVASLRSPMALILVWAGALPLILSIVGAGNHGTLDNASGVAAVLDAAALLPPACPIGILITDAEELALAGAAAWARDTRPAIALNCDSVDDQGDLVIMYTGKAPEAVVTALRGAAARRPDAIRVMRLIPGILTDSVALGRAGWSTVTLSRGTTRTLRRIHTSRDTLAHMDGRGIDGAAHVLAQAATELAACR